jgi:RHS repeat-associated protein
VYLHSSLASFTTSEPTDRGYTGHKHIKDLDIIHMGGRIYDPTLGRFLQADPNIQAPLNSQSYNRYAYVLNNPMSMTDPSGYFFKWVKNTVKKYWKVIVAVAVTYFTAGAASGWAASWGFAAGTVGNSVLAGTIAGAAGGFTAGALVTGSLKGALRGSFSGAIAGAAGGYANLGSVGGWGDAAKRVGVAALGGCGAGKASGGSCSKGAKMAAVIQAVSMGASEAYKQVSSKYNKSGKPHLWKEGKPDVGKQLKETVPKHYWGQSDQAGVMQDIAKGPYMDSFAEFHDGLHDMFTDVLGKGDLITNNGVSLIFTMPHSYGLTLLAAASPYNYAYTSYKLMNENE